MFLYDKYSPKTNADLTFHQDIVQKIQQMGKDDEIPHLILYGADGSGKKTIARLFLESIFDKDVNNTVNKIYTINGSGNKTTNIAIKQSPYHIVIEPNNNNFDRYLIQNIVKEYAKWIPVGVFRINKSFKVVLINNVDNLSYYAQMSLRRTMEKYSKTCRFLMVCNAISKLIDPLKSRCICIRIPSPTEEEIIGTIMQVSYHEKNKMSLKNLCEIMKYSNGSIKQVLLALECVSNNISPSNSYIHTIKKIVKLINEKNIEHVVEIRGLLYDILMTNISGSHIITSILLMLCNSVELKFEKKLKLIESAAKYEHNLSIGRREIIHLDSFVIDTILILS